MRTIDNIVELCKKNIFQIELLENNNSLLIDREKLRLQKDIFEMILFYINN
jgi:hypothetical protein